MSNAEVVPGIVIQAFQGPWEGAQIEIDEVVPPVELEYAREIRVLGLKTERTGHSRHSDTTGWGILPKNWAVVQETDPWE